MPRSRTDQKKPGLENVVEKILAFKVPPRKVKKRKRKKEGDEG